MRVLQDQDPLGRADRLPPEGYCSAVGAQMEVVEAIFEPDISLVVLQRPVEWEIARYLRSLGSDLRDEESRQCFTLANRQEARLFGSLPAGPGRDALVADYFWQLELFTVVADASEVGVRLVSTHEQTCPRFHVDHVALRQICTWQGNATQWLEHADVDRCFLGSRSGGKGDEESGLLRQGASIQVMAAFDIGIMKGEWWPGNTGRGLVHRSPRPGRLPRLMITFDALN